MFNPYNGLGVSQSSDYDTIRKKYISFKLFLIRFMK